MTYISSLFTYDTDRQSPRGESTKKVHSRGSRSKDLEQGKGAADSTVPFQQQ